MCSQASQPASAHCSLHVLPSPTTLMRVCIICPPIGLCTAPQVVLRYDAGRGPVTALAVTPEECFLAGALLAGHALLLVGPHANECYASGATALRCSARRWIAALAFCLTGTFSV